MEKDFNIPLDSKGGFSEPIKNHLPTMEKKTKEQFLTRGTGSFIHCTDYEDALKAMESHKDQEGEEKDKQILRLQDSLLEITRKSIEQIESLHKRNKELTMFNGFWGRLKDFVSNVQVNDMMSEEEKQMIIGVCEEQLLSNKGK